MNHAEAFSVSATDADCGDEMLTPQISSATRLRRSDVRFPDEEFGLKIAHPLRLDRGEVALFAEIAFEVE